MSTPTSRTPAGTRAVAVLLVPLVLVLFMATLDQTIVATSIGGIGRALHDTRNASWIATAYLLTSAVSTLIFGKLGDMYGRKKIFEVAVAVFLAGSLLSGVASSMGMLIVVRAVQGAGGGGLSSLAQAITGDLIPARQRSKYQAYIGVVVTLAIVAGPLLGGLFVDDLSWRWIFFVNLPIGGVALAVIARRLQLPVRHSAARVDLAGGLLATSFTTTALLVTVWGGERYGWGSPAILGLLGGTAVALVLYWYNERCAAAPITPLHLFRNPVFTISSALFFLATLVLFAVLLYVPMFMQSVHHYSSFAAGLFTIPLLVGLIAAAGLAGGVVAKTGRYKVFPVAGATLAGGGMYLVSLVGAGTPAAVLGDLEVIVGTGLGFFVQVALLAGQNAVESEHLGVATGALNFFKTLGGAFGAALFGAILTSRLGQGAVTIHREVVGFQRVFFWAVPFMVLALVLSVAMRERPLSEAMLEVVAGNVEVPEY